MTSWRQPRVCQSAKCYCSSGWPKFTWYVAAI